MKKKPNLLSPGEYVVTAWAESSAGPGWSNTPLWVLVGSPSGTYRVECLQPEDQTKEIRVLYSISQACHHRLKDQVTQTPLFKERRLV